MQLSYTCCLKPVFLYQTKAVIGEQHQHVSLMVIKLKKIKAKGRKTNVY